MCMNSFDSQKTRQGKYHTFATGKLVPWPQSNSQITRPGVWRKGNKICYSLDKKEDNESQPLKALSSFFFFLCGTRVWILISGPQACSAGILPLELCPQPCHTTFERKRHVKVCDKTHVPEQEMALGLISQFIDAICPKLYILVDRGSLLLGGQTEKRGRRLSGLVKSKDC
jgi:hypothetical protein